MEAIRNKIAESGIITLDLENFMPKDEEIAVFDIQPYLFQGLILREKDFRTALAEFDFTIYKDKYVGVFCSADALVPMWAYMLVVTHLESIAVGVYYGDHEATLYQVTNDRIRNIDRDEYLDARVILKGCGKRNAKESMYITATEQLQPVAKMIMFGEPCSTVPVYKKKKVTS